MSHIFEKECKITGTFGQNINKCFTNYEEACQGYEHTKKQTLRYLCMLVDGKQKCFFESLLQQ